MISVRLLSLRCRKREERGVKGRDIEKKRRGWKERR